MTLATRPFGNLFNFSRNSTKWEMGPNGKFIEYPVGAPAYRHDPVTGEKLGISFNETTTTLQGSSLQSYQSLNFETVDAVSLFDGKVAKRVTNVHQSASVGAPYTIGALPARGATAILYVEITSTPRIMFGFRDQTNSFWEAGFTFDPVTEELSRVQGSQSVTVGALKLKEIGPSGGPVYMLYMTILAQVNSGATLALYHYPAYQDDTYTDPRESVIHYVGVIDYPYPQMSPIWVDGTNLTRPTDYCHIDPIPSAALEVPRTVYCEMIADTPCVGVSDSFHGGIGFVRSGGGITDRAWIGYRGVTGEEPRAQVVNAEGGLSQLGQTNVPLGGLLKTCLGWDATKAGFATNGDYSEALGDRTIPTSNRKRLQVGHAITSSRPLNGLIKKIRVVNELWSQERMEQETAA
ncbi:hypothetical protein ACEK07_22970 [Alcanivoracaceae bacterium MT1]